MNHTSLLALTLAASALLAVGCGGGQPAGSDAAATPGHDGAGRKLASPDDLRDQRVGVLLGSVHDTYATRTWPEATVVHFQAGNDLALAVATGKVDAGLSDLQPFLERQRVNDALAMLGEPLVSFPVAAGFRKDGDALREEFNRYLAEIERDGTHADMVERWLSGHEGTVVEVAPAAAATDKLVVGITSGGLPFAAIQDGRLVGFDVELVERFAARTGRRIVYSDMPFAGLIAACASGKVDMIVASIFITEERQQRIDFSDPYYETPVVAYTTKSRLAGGPEETTPAAPRHSFLAGVVASFESNILAERRYLLLWDGLKTTAIISALATLLGTALGALVCFMRMSRLRVLNLPARAYISLLRGMPIVVFLMLIFYVVFASVDIEPVLVAVVAFGMNFAAYVSEMFRTGVEGVHKGQTEAGTAMGFTRGQTFGFIVLPQMIQRILPVYKGEFISLVKMTSIVGYIAVQDLTKASDIIRSRTFDAFFPLVMVSVLYFLISWLLLRALGWLERATDPKERRRRQAVAP